MTDSWTSASFLETNVDDQYAGKVLACAISAPQETWLCSPDRSGGHLSLRSTVDGPYIGAETSSPRRGRTMFSELNRDPTRYHDVSRLPRTGYTAKTNSGHTMEERIVG